MYAVVGCRECEALWVVEGRPETTGCPRCGTRHRFSQLKAFVETEAKERAREVRASILAARQDQENTLIDVAPPGGDADWLEAVGVSDEEYLEGVGIDPAAVADAGDDASPRGARPSRRDIVLSAIETLDAPAREDVLEYAMDRDVPEDAARRALDKLVRAGEVTEHRGRYRRL